MVQERVSTHTASALGFPFPSPHPAWERCPRYEELQDKGPRGQYLLGVRMRKSVGWGSAGRG